MPDSWVSVVQNNIINVQEFVLNASLASQAFPMLIWVWRHHKTAKSSHSYMNNSYWSYLMVANNINSLDKNNIIINYLLLAHWQYHNFIQNVFFFAQRCLGRCLGGGLLIGCHGDLLVTEDKASSFIPTFLAPPPPINQSNVLNWNWHILHSLIKQLGTGLLKKRREDCAHCIDNCKDNISTFLFSRSQIVAF